MKHTYWINKHNDLNNEGRLTITDICCFVVGAIGFVYVLAVVITQ